MKKTLLSLIFIYLSVTAIAQPSKVTSAWNYLNNGQFDKAKQNIEEALVHEKTMKSAKTWFYRGNVYLNIYLINNTTSKGIFDGMSKDNVIKKAGKPYSTKNIVIDNVNIEQLEYKDEDEYRLFINFNNNRIESWYKQGPFKELDSNSLETAYSSYQKAIELDPEKEFFNDIMTRLMVCGEQFYNQGVMNFNKKLYNDAMSSFDRTIKINEIFGQKDSLATYNAASAAVLSKQYDKAKKYYVKLIQINYTNPVIYTQLSNIYKQDNDTVKALKTVQLGRKKFPDDFNLIITETNIYLATGQTQKAQDNLMIAIQKDPNNKMIYFAIGSNYDQMKNIEKASESYKKAIEIDSNYFDAIYNLGALYFNEGVKIFENADKISDNDLYLIEKNKFDKMWANALPYLEKALELNPNDMNTLISLKQLYARTSRPDKLKVVSDKINLLNNK